MFHGRVMTSLLLALCACTENGDSFPADAAHDSAAVPVNVDSAARTPLNAGSPDVRSALEAVVRGPTAAERAAGAQSWFSEETAGVLRSAEVDSAGHAVVDFHDLRDFIPNASSSAGSMLLLDELNAAVFSVPGILSVEYRMDGSCDLFWEWLQYGCHIVTRPEN